MFIKPPDFVKQIVHAYKKGRGLFSKKTNAEELIPAGMNGLEKSLYLFYVIQLDYATKSQRLYAGAKRLHGAVPNFFSPTTIKKMDNRKLENYLRDYLGPRYINEAMFRYKTNSVRLLKDYGGDPRNIFLNTRSAKEVLKRVLSFRGFGPKIGNFFIRTMINVFNYSYADVGEILPPVDVHDVRIAYLLGYVKSGDMTQKNIKDVKRLWSTACKEANKSWLVFDKALWLLGSEGLPKSREDVFSLLKQQSAEKASR